MLKIVQIAMGRPPEPFKTQNSKINQKLYKKKKKKKEI